MKLKEALTGDYRKEEVKQYIQGMLKKIPQLSKYDTEDDVPFEVLEKALWKLSEKSGIVVQYLTPVYQTNSPNYYTCSFAESATRNFVQAIYGLTVYEIYAKGVLMCYSYSRKSDKNLQ